MFSFLLLLRCACCCLEMLLHGLPDAMACGYACWPAAVVRMLHSPRRAWVCSCTSLPDTVGRHRPSLGSAEPPLLRACCILTHVVMLAAT